MKTYVFLCFISLISSNGLSHAGYIQKRFKRTHETSTQLGLGSKDKESLQEALEILNLGKHTLNLPTEDTQLLLQLANVSSNDTDKSDQIEKFVEGPSGDNFSSNSKQYLALSGENGQIHVHNSSFVTPGPEETSTNKNIEVQDVFKIVVRKKVPGSKDNAVHKISIVETDRVEPLARMEYPQSKRKRRKGTSFWIDSLGIPRARKKRTNADPLLRFIRGDFSAKDIDEMFADKGTSGLHSIKIRNQLQKDKFRENNRLWKRKSEHRDAKGHAGNEFQEAAPWIRSHYRSEVLPERGFRTESFHTRRDANKHRKFRTPLNDLQSSNWQVWRHPLKLKSWTGDEYIDDVLKTSNSDKTIDKALSYEGLGHYFLTTKALILSKNRTTRAHSSKHSFIKKNITSASPNPNTSSQSYTTESGTTFQHEKIAPDSDIAIDRYAFEKSAIFPSESSIKENHSASISEVAIVVFIGFLCIATVFLVFSIAVRWHPQKTCCGTLNLKGAQVTVNINDSSSDKKHRLPFKSHSELYYRKMDVQEDEENDFYLPDFEWQSEVGEWLSDHGSVRQAIAFEEI